MVVENRRAGQLFGPKNVRFTCDPAVAWLCPDNSTWATIGHALPCRMRLKPGGPLLPALARASRRADVECIGPMIVEQFEIGPRAGQRNEQQTSCHQYPFHYAPPLTLLNRRSTVVKQLGSLHAKNGGKSIWKIYAACALMTS
jgi:hypothetical protein